MSVPHPGSGGTAPPGAEPDGDVGTPPERRWRRRRWQRGVLGVAVVGLLGVEVALGAPTLAGAVTALGGAQPWWIVAAVLAEVASMDLFARLRRRLLAAAGVRVRMRDALAGVYAAGAVHLTVPGGAAVSTAYAFRWMREQGAGAAAVTWTLAAGGVISTSALAALAVTGSLLVGATSNLLTLVLDAVFVVALVVGVRRLRRRPDLALVAGLHLLTWRNRLLRRPPAQGKASLERSVGQLGLVRPGVQDWSVAVAYGAGNWLFDIGCLAAGVAALGVHGVSLPLLLIAYTAGMAASGISVLPGGIGVVDTAMVLALVAGGIPATAALPALLLYRLISLVGVAAAGWLVAAVHARRTRGGLPVSHRPARPRPSDRSAEGHLAASTVRRVPSAGGRDPRWQRCLRRRRAEVSALSKAIRHDTDRGRRNPE